MMKPRLTWVALPVLMLACNKHDPDPYPTQPQPVAPDTMATVHFTLNPRWAGAPFDKTIVYTNAPGHRVLVQQLKLYLGDMSLDSAGWSRGVEDIDLFDVTNGPVERYYMVEAGVYDHFRFGVGVPEDLNHTDPVLYPNGHPLSALSGMFWTWASLYRFMIFDGQWDAPGTTGPAPLPFLLSVHTGLDTCYREVQLSGFLDAGAGDTLDLVLNIDLDRFFYNATDTFKLNETPQWHGEATDLSTGLRFSDLVSGSFSLQ